MKKFTESLSNIKKVTGTPLVYFDLFPLLEGLESERPGIKKRVWTWMCEEDDVAFSPHKNRISNINLFYFGAGDEYPIKEMDETELQHSRETFPESFVDGIEKELRLDLNLVWSVYEDEISDVESFPVLVFW